MAKKSTGRVAQLKLEINKLEVRKSLFLVMTTSFFIMYVHTQGDLKSNKPVGTGVYEELDCNMVSSVYHVIIIVGWTAVEAREQHS